jgi:hypothetical protein
MSYITPISALETENLSGCVSLRIVPVADIASYPRNIGGRLIGDITFVPGKTWTTWKPIDGTFLFQCQHEDSPEGIARRHSIQFTLPAKGVNEYTLETMQYDRLIALVTDRNTNEFIFGSPQVPITFRYNRNTGNTLSGRNEYTCSLSGSQFRSRAIYTGAIIQNDGAIIDHLDNDLIDHLENIITY